MNKINLYKQLATFVLMIATIFALSYINAEFFRALMFVIGSWTVGASVGKFAKNKWPLYNKESQNDD